MSGDRQVDYLVSLVHELCELPRETEWVEFKVNDAEPQEIGEQISALANAAALVGKAFAYLAWGVRNNDHVVVGTTFDPHAARFGNEELENWLLRLLEPKIDFRFFTVALDERPVVLLEIIRAARHPVRFSGQEFMRVGSYKKKLKDFPEKERALWRIFDQTPFEDGVTTEHATGDDVLRLLDYPTYFDLLDRPLPANRDGILTALADDQLIRHSDAGGWDITNLGAILFAKRLDAFRALRRFRICEERGTGIDKVVFQVELFQLPAPLFEKPAGFTRVVLFAHKPLSAMGKVDRVRSCYLHACLCYVTRKEMTNTTLRARFGEHNRAAVSRFIREAVEARAIVPADPDAAPKLMRYVPFWAAETQDARV